jgi:hypothetical protein
VYFEHQPSSRIIANNNIAYTGSQASTPSTTFTAQTWQIRAVSTVTGYLRIDSGDGGVTTATTNDALLIANAPPEYFACSGGQSAAFISTSTSSGVCSIAEMA